MIISVTERGTYKRCHKRWDYTSRNRQNLTNVVPSLALSLGSLIHKAHEVWIDNPDKEPEDIFGVLALRELEAMKLRYRKYVGADISEEELGPFWETYGLGHEMMHNYKVHWKTPLPEGFEFVQPEQTVIVPIPNTQYPCVCFALDKECQHCQGTGKAYHYLEGTLDAIIRDSISGAIFVLERKTYGQRPKLNTLETNDQFLAYSWILSKLNIGPVGGVAYDGMWKRGIEKQRGPSRSLDDLFLRVLLTRSQQELVNFENELTIEAKEMAHPPIYRNFKWDGCWDCGMQDLCLAEYRGDDATTLRQEKYMVRPHDIEWPTDENEE